MKYELGRKLDQILEQLVTGGRRLDDICLQLARLESKQEKIMIDLTSLTAEVTANTNATNAAKTVLAALTAEIASISAGSTDPATQTQLNALVATLQANDQGLAAAVVANTLAAPPASS